MVVLAAEGKRPRVARICAAPLALAFGPDQVIALGGGGFAFRVSDTLDPRLEAVQTQRDLFALARAPNGVGWCAGAEQRVLKRGPSGLSRAGSLPGSGRILALHAMTARVHAFADDGGVLEGSA